MIHWAFLLRPCQLQSRGLWYSKKQLRRLLRLGVTLHFAHTTVLNVFTLGTQFLHRSRLLAIVGRCPTPSFLTSSWGWLGVNFLFFIGGEGRLTGRPLGAFPVEIGLSDKLAMKVLSLSGRSFSWWLWRLWIFQAFTTQMKVAWYMRYVYQRLDRMVYLYSDTWWLCWSIPPPPKTVVHTNNCRACDVNVEFGLPVIPFDLLNWLNRDEVWH